MNTVLRWALAIAARSSNEGFWSPSRVIVTRRPCRASSLRTARDIRSTTSFSIAPVAPRAPESVPPWPGSSTTVVRTRCGGAIGGGACDCGGAWGGGGWGCSCCCGAGCCVFEGKGSASAAAISSSETERERRTARKNSRNESQSQVHRKSCAVSPQRGCLTAPLRLIPGEADLPDLANLLWRLGHRLARFAGEGPRELRHIHHHAVDAVNRRRMGIGHGTHTEILGALVGAIPLGKPDEETLLGGEAVDGLKVFVL